MDRNQPDRQEARAFYARTLRMTLPIVLQNFMDSAVGAADVVMLSVVSQTALTSCLGDWAETFRASVNRIKILIIVFKIFLKSKILVQSY